MRHHPQTPPTTDYYLPMSPCIRDCELGMLAGWSWFGVSPAVVGTAEAGAPGLAGMQSQGFSTGSHSLASLAWWHQGSKGRCPKRNWEATQKSQGATAIILFIEAVAKVCPSSRGINCVLDWGVLNLYKHCEKPPPSWREESPQKGLQEGPERFLLKGKAWWEY